MAIAQTSVPESSSKLFDWQSPQRLIAECEKGDSKSCQTISVYYALGQGIPGDGVLAARYADMACSGGLGEVCSELARRLAYPKPELALPYFRKSCDIGYYFSCNTLSYMIRNGEGTTANPIEAQYILDNALAKVLPECESGDGVSCHYAALLVDYGTLGTEGDPEQIRIDQFYAKAVNYMSKDCDGPDAKNCDNLAGLYRSGNGVPKDLNAYARYSSRSCFAGRVEACDEMAHYAYTPFSDKITNAEKGCQLGSVSLCFELGNTFKSGTVVKKDKERANALFKQGCGFGHIASCYNYGLALADAKNVNRDYVLAREYLSKVCGFGFQEACKAIAKLDKDKP